MKKLILPNTMNRLILFSIFSILCSGAFAQETSIATSESYQNFRTKTQTNIISLFDGNSEKAMSRIGDLSVLSLNKQDRKQESNIKIIVSQMQNLLNTEGEQDFKNIKFHGAQKSICDGVETVELIKNNSFKIENFVASYLNKYFK